jgi:hypothetical protein
MMKTSDSPQMLFLDLRPVNYPMVIVASHDIAEQISRVTKLNPESVPKSPTMQQGYRRLIGANSIISEGVNILFLPLSCIDVSQYSVYTAILYRWFLKHHNTTLGFVLLQLTPPIGRKVEIASQTF